MKRAKNPELFTLIHEYFRVYLPRQKQCRPNTIKAYQVAMELLLDYVKEKRDIRLADVSIDMLDQRTIIAFLNWLENKRGCSVATRNLRLQGIRSFFAFAADADPTLMVHRNNVYKVKLAKAPKSIAVTYMSETALAAVLAQPDTSTARGFRDMFLMVLLYDTGARIQEVMDIQLKDIRFADPPLVTLRGKEQKIRNVALMGATVKHYRKYLEVFHEGEDFRYSERYLFYSTRNGIPCRMTEDNIRKRVHSYGTAARKSCLEVPENVHPHMFRHTRAMHLYQHGMPLPLISQWLGHSELETTLIYAHADSEMKRKAIEAATPESSPLRGFMNADRFVISDDNMVKRLYGLR